MIGVPQTLDELLEPGTYEIYLNWRKPKYPLHLSFLLVDGHVIKRKSDMNFGAPVVFTRLPNPTNSHFEIDLYLSVEAPLDNFVAVLRNRITQKYVTLIEPTGPLKRGAMPSVSKRFKLP